METEQVDHNKVARVQQLLSTIAFLDKCKQADQAQGGKKQGYWNEQIHKAKQDLLRTAKA